MATLTAASDFPHKYVSNISVGDYVQSGTLHKKAIVTQSEMIEHSFYQGLNLCQAMYLHVMCHLRDANILVRFFFLWLVTVPWYFRSLLPVHSFSHNWKLYIKHKQQQEQQQQQHQTGVAAAEEEASSGTRCARKKVWTIDGEDMEVIMYKIKKAQYIFYKHFIFHGVNQSALISVDTTKEIPYSSSWRTFWILLNASYVMEFFLQTMVKRRVFDQSTMLFYNRFLMASSSLGAMVVLKYVKLWIVCLSVLLNFCHRHHDVSNAVGIALTNIVVDGVVNQ
jgi:hypothetical protein